MATNTDLYHADFAAWCEATAALIRAGHWEALDAEVLAEEVDALARSEHRELHNRLEVLAMHLLKWRYQPEQRGPSWASTIQEQRRALDRLLADNPSLRREVSTALEAIYPAARQHALEEMRPGWPGPPPPPRQLQGMRIVSPGFPRTLPETCPWSAEAVRNPDYWPDMPSDAP